MIHGRPVSRNEEDRGSTSVERKGEAWTVYTVTEEKGKRGESRP